MLPSDTVKFWQTLLLYPPPVKRSILDPIPLGRLLADRGRDAGGAGGAAACLRENVAHVWGLRGAGKTMMLANFVAGGMQCTDALVWAAGRDITRPFLRPFVEGRVQKPAIDWPGSTEAELGEMVEAAMQVVLDRRAEYGDLKELKNTDRMPIGGAGELAGPPAIILVVDCDVLLTGVSADTIMSRLHQVIDLGRDVGVTVVTSELGLNPGGPLSWQPGIRIGLRPTDSFSTVTGFGYDAGGTSGFDPITACGGGYISTDFGLTVDAFRGYLLTPNDMSSCGERTAGWRPEMDAVSRRAAGEAYANRWRVSAPQLWPSARVRDEVCAYA